MPDKILSLMLASIQFLSFKEKLILLGKLDNSRDLALLSIDDMSLAVGRRIRSRSWNGREYLRQAEQGARLLDMFEIRTLMHDDADYPALVREIFDPPFMLFCRGNLNAARNPCVSVVGTRKPTQAGAVAAHDFAKAAAADGCTVVSGLAFGIDACAHRGAVSARGMSVGVLPCGADAVFPASNRRLAVAVLENGGCLLSEYLPGVRPAKFRFPQRNRIISALSPATVIAEAPPKSGALITADFALEQGRDVYLHAAALAVPEERCGVLGLRQDGAPVVGSYEEYVRCRAAAPGTACCRPDRQLNF